MAKKLWLGMLAMTLAFGMIVIGCDTGTGGGAGGIDTALVGTWDFIGDDMTYVFAGNGDLRIYGDGQHVETMRWSTRNGMLTLSGGGDSMTIPYSISGNTLTLHFGVGDVDTFTRR